MSLKEDFIKRALAKEMPFSRLCAEYQITRKSGYLLLNRYLKDGPGGLLPKSRRPLTSPNKTDLQTEEAIIKLRLEEPTWGAKKILCFLQRKKTCNLPALSTINTILKRHNLISVEESLKRQKLIRFERESPNDLWQMDFKGRFQLLTKKSCYPLTIIDDHSRYSLTIKACQNERYLTVKNQLFYVFKKYGLPTQINVDNGSPWGNSKLLRHTALTVWLMQLGIRVTHSRPRHPQTNGKCERFHRTLKNDLINRHPMRSISHAQKLFDKWRERYNYERPHEAIKMKVPAELYTVSTRQMPQKIFRIEYDSDATVRKVRGNGYISYKNKEYLVGEAFKGMEIEIKDNPLNSSIHLYFGSFEVYNYDY